MHISSPIATKKADNFLPAAHPIIITNFIWGKNINQEVGVGAKNEFQI